MPVIAVSCGYNEHRLPQPAVLSLAPECFSHSNMVAYEIRRAFASIRGILESDIGLRLAGEPSVSGDE